MNAKSLSLESLITLQTFPISLFALWLKGNYRSLGGNFYGTGGVESIRSVILHLIMRNVFFLTIFQPLQADDMTAFFWSIIWALEPWITMSSYRRKVLSFNCTYLVTQTEAMAWEWLVSQWQLLALELALKSYYKLYWSIQCHGRGKPNKTKITKRPPLRL